jgi:predicted membrane GTPase involved in stress response
MASPSSGVVLVFRHADRTKQTAEIVAHADRGKTTLVDGMLKQARVFCDNHPVAGRVISMVEAVMLPVDPAEGPMPQPWFVIHLPLS